MPTKVSKLTFHGPFVFRAVAPKASASDGIGYRLSRRTSAIWPALTIAPWTMATTMPAAAAAAAAGIIHDAQRNAASVARLLLRGLQ